MKGIKKVEIEDTGSFAFVLENKAEGLFTMFLEEMGGPVITGSTYEETYKKFLEALSVANSVRKLRMYENVYHRMGDT